MKFRVLESKLCDGRTSGREEVGLIHLAVCWEWWHVLPCPWTWWLGPFNFRWTAPERKASLRERKSGQAQRMEGFACVGLEIRQRQGPFEHIEPRGWRQSRGSFNLCALRRLVILQPIGYQEMVKRALGV